MATIYRNALRTVIWLGQATARHDSGAAFRILGALTKARFAKNNLGSAPSVDEESSSEADESCRDLSALSNDRAAEKLRDAIEGLVVMPWFSRVWIVQEILLARSAYIICGSDAMIWHNFCEGVKEGLESGLLSYQPLGLHTWDPYGPVLGLSEVIQNDPQICAAARLVHMLHTNRGRQATEPVDKVYGLLGLVGEDLGSLGIKPTYQSSHEEVYKCVAVSTLQNGSDLDILGMCDFVAVGKESTKLPSWVPDWSVSQYVTRPLTMTEGGRLHSFRTTRLSKPEVRFSWDENILLLSGHTIDMIKEVAEVLPPFIEDVDRNKTNASLPGDSADQGDSADHASGGDLREGQVTSWLRRVLPEGLADAASFFTVNVKEFITVDVKEFLEDMPLGDYEWVVDTFERFVRWEQFALSRAKISNSMNRKAATTMYWKTLCAGNRLPGGEEATEAAFRQWRKTLGVTRNLCRLHANALPSSAYKPVAFIGYLQKTWKAYSKFTEVLVHLYNRKLAWTAQGHLALVPAGAQAEDAIVLCKGGKVPLCLRRVDEASHTLLGEAYVDSIVDGSAFNEARCEAIAIR